MDNEKLIEQPKFKFYPSDNPNFSPGLEVEFTSAIGQTFLETVDTLPEDIQKSDITLQVRFKITAKQNAKKVIDLVKGLYAMAKMAISNDDEELGNLFNSVKLDFKSDDDYVYIFIGASSYV